MKFSGRIGSTSSSRHRRAWHRYWLHLGEHGFTAREIVYRMFAGEVFHDGELSIHHLDLATQTLVLELRNVYAVDQVSSSPAYQRNRNRRDLDRNDFKTLVSFTQVEALQIRTHPSIRAPVYYCAELSRRAERLALEITFIDEAVTHAEGTIRFTFATVEIEDLRPRLRKYVGEFVASTILTPITKNPSDYAADPLPTKQG